MKNYVDCNDLLIENRKTLDKDSRFAKSVEDVVKDFYAGKGANLNIIRAVDKLNEFWLGDIISIILKTVENSKMEVTIEDYFVVKQMKDRKRWSVFIFIDSLGSFEKFYPKLSSNSFKFRRFTTVVAIKSLSDDNVETIFKMFWKLLIKNVNLVMRNSSNDIVELFTFIPFQVGKCGDSKPKKINSFETKWESQAFHLRKVDNFYQCPIVIGAASGSSEPAVMGRLDSKGQVELYGVEIDIFKELGRIFNFKPMFEAHGVFPGLVFENGTATGLMRKAIDGEVDAAIGLISLQLTRTLFLSDSKAYATIPLAMIVPAGEEYGDLEKFARPFSMSVWVGVLCVTGLTSLVIYTAMLSSNKAYNFIIGQNVKTPFYNFEAVVLGVGVTFNSIPSRNFARFVLMSNLLYYLVMRTAYQAEYYNILKSNDRKPEVTSIKEMQQKKYTFYIYQTLAPRVSNFKFYESRLIYPNEDIGEMRMKTLDPKFQGVVFNYLEQVTYLNQINFRNFTYRICKEKFTTNQFVFYFKKNHYLVDEVNEKLELLLQNGVINYIRSSYADVRFQKSDQESSEPKVLTIKHFAGAFMLFGMFCAYSFFVFLLEMLMKFNRLKRFRAIEVLNSIFS